MATVHRVSMMVYNSLQFKSVKTQHNIQIQKYETSVLKNVIIYMIKYVDNDDKIFRTL